MKEFESTIDEVTKYLQDNMPTLKERATIIERFRALDPNLEGAYSNLVKAPINGEAREDIEDVIQDAIGFLLEGVDCNNGYLEDIAYSYITAHQ